MKYSLGISFFLFLQRSLVFPILLFFSISLHWSPRKVFLSLLAIFWNSALKWVYLSFSPLPSVSLLFSICKASSENHFAFLHFFFLGVVLIPASCMNLVLGSSGILSDLIPWIYVSLLLYNHKGFEFRSYLNGLVVVSTFFNLSLNLAIRSS